MKKGRPETAADAQSRGTRLRFIPFPSIQLGSHLFVTNISRVAGLSGTAGTTLHISSICGGSIHGKITHQAVASIIEILPPLFQAV